MTQLPTFGDAELRALYNEDATSPEASGRRRRAASPGSSRRTALGADAVGRDLEGEAVWVGRDTICIEWDAKVNLRDGRKVQPARGRSPRDQGRQDPERALLLQPAGARAAERLAVRTGSPRESAAPRELERIRGGSGRARAPRRFHPQHRRGRPRGRQERRPRRHALSARAERLPAHRARQGDLPRLRRRRGERRHLPPALRRHEPDRRGGRVRRLDQGATCAGSASTGASTSTSRPTTSTSSTRSRCS